MRVPDTPQGGFALLDVGCIKWGLCCSLPLMDTRNQLETLLGWSGPVFINILLVVPHPEPAMCWLINHSFILVCVAWTHWCDLMPLRHLCTCKTHYILPHMGYYIESPISPWPTHWVSTSGSLNHCENGPYNWEVSATFWFHGKVWAFAWQWGLNCNRYCLLCRAKR
jgi:hypothetical protein